MSLDTADRRLFLVALLSWLAIIALCWPQALSFADELGYVGHAKLLLHGQLQPTRFDPGIWVAGPHGLVSKYPLLLSALLAPLLALSPRAVFVPGVAALIALACIAARVLSSWGRRPLWGLIVLAHPTLVIVARTAMADVLLSALGVAAWAALRAGRRAAIVVLFALLVCIKPIGAVVAGGLLVGEAVRVVWQQPRAASAGWRAIAYAALGSVLGGIATLWLTWIATGGLRFGYQLAQPAAQAFFAVAHVPDHALVYASALLSCPPLLVLGLLPLWRRREFGPVLVAVGLVAMMSAFFFADRGVGWLETLVLSQRLILPAVSFLLIGYADGVAGLCERWPRLQRVSTLVLVAAPLVVALAVSSLHQRWQRPMARALAAAAPFADRAGGELALTEAAFKAGLLYAGRTSVFDSSAARAKVVLCSTRTWSHRSQVVHASCAFAGYHSVRRVGEFDVLVRDADIEPHR